MKKSLYLSTKTFIRPHPYKYVGLVLGLILLSICLIVNIRYGAASLSWKTIWDSLTAFDGSIEQSIVTSMRIPRAAITMSVGAALAVAGTVMQGLTRNPLADPGILGIESGASLAMVLSLLLGDGNFSEIQILFSLLGAGITALLVYLLSCLSPGGANPLNLTLAGAAVTAFLSSLTTGILILRQDTLEEIRFWLAGSVAGRDFELFLEVLPYLLVGLAIALILGKQISLLNLGDDLAKGLGQRTALVKISATISVVLLAGSSVAIAGSIGFIGLIVPHIVRF